MSISRESESLISTNQIVVAESKAGLVTAGTSRPLPTCHFTWIGPPSAIDNSEHKEVGHDIDGVIKFAKYAENPVVFYCLEEYSEYYKKEFEKQGVANIQVKSAESLIKECHDSKDAYLTSQADLISKLFKDNLKRATKRDLVTVKELMSLLIIYINGGYALDSNIQPLEMKPFSLPSYDDIMAPSLGYMYEVWMLFAPKDNEKVKNGIKYFLEAWQEAEKIYQESGGDTPQWRAQVGPMINGAVQFGAIDPDAMWIIPKDHIWAYSHPGTEATVKMPNLNLIKHYQGTHKTPTQKAGIVIGHKDWEKDPSSQAALSFADIKEIFKLAIDKQDREALKYISEKKNDLTPFIKAVYDFITGRSDARSFFTIISNIEKTSPSIAKDIQELQPAIEKAFIWSIKRHPGQYAKILLSKEETQKNDAVTTLCNKHLSTIKSQFSETIWNELKKKFELEGKLKVLDAAVSKRKPFEIAKKIKTTESISREDANTKQKFKLFSAKKEETSNKESSNKAIKFNT